MKSKKMRLFTPLPSRRTILYFSVTWLSISATFSLPLFPDIFPGCRSLFFCQNLKYAPGKCRPRESDDSGSANDVFLFVVCERLCFFLSATCLLKIYPNRAIIPRSWHARSLGLTAQSSSCQTRSHFSKHIVGSDEIPNYSVTQFIVFTRFVYKTRDQPAKAPHFRSTNTSWKNERSWTKKKSFWHIDAVVFIRYTFPVSKVTEPRVCSLIRHHPLQPLFFLVRAIRFLLFYLPDSKFNDKSMRTKIITVNQRTTWKFWFYSFEKQKKNLFTYVEGKIKRLIPKCIYLVFHSTIQIAKVVLHACESYKL